MMGRQRTICDSFWRDPKLAHLTQEDKATLLYLLTGPSSNTIGVYPIVPRIGAAEMGWTADQFVLVLRRLNELDLVRYEPESNWLWVRVWWDHNNAGQVLGQKLIERTWSQVSSIPSQWQKEWIHEFKRVCPAILDKVPIRYRSDIATVSDGASSNNVTKHSSNAIAAQDKANRSVDGPGYRKFSEILLALQGGSGK